MKEKIYVHCLPDISFVSEKGVFDLSVAKGGQFREDRISEGDVVINFRCAMCGKGDFASLKEVLDGVECDCGWTFFLVIKGVSSYFFGG